MSVLSSLFSDVESTPGSDRVAQWIRSNGADLVLLSGAFSVVLFWTFGLGILLGVEAVAVGIPLARIEDVDPERRSLEVLAGILGGGFGILAGLIFLTPPYRTGERFFPFLFL